jgi:hypothetical protein
MPIESAEPLVALAAPNQQSPINNQQRIANQRSAITNDFGIG